MSRIRDIPKCFSPLSKFSGGKKRAYGKCFPPAPPLKGREETNFVFTPGRQGRHWDEH